MNTFFKKSTLAALALTFAIPATLATQSPAQASNKDVIVGAIVGGIVAKHIVNKKAKHKYKKSHKSYHTPKHKHHVQKKKYHAPQPKYDSYKRAHVNWCFDNYRTYDVRNNTFKDYDGYIKQCYSPYS